MKELEFFMNERMKILQIINDHQIKLGDNRFCPLSQQEIADLVPCSKLKANQTIKELIFNGYVQMARSRGRYIVTEKGAEFIKGIVNRCRTQLINKTGIDCFNSQKD